METESLELTAAAPAGAIDSQPLVTEVAGPEWSQAQRITFRFVFAYFALYNLTVLANTAGSLIPGVTYFIAQYVNLWHVIVPWVGKAVLQLDKPITYFPSGSGDKTSDYVQLLCYVAIAVTATVVWSILDRKRTEYRWLYKCLHVYVRYAVAFTMLSYGMAKLIKLQFQYPGLSRLLEPLGDFSPMGLLWTFMGYSTPYTFFAGAAEFAGGMLLFFRRTATLGAIVTASVMLNVAMMNFAYDVPVKLLATHLALMCLFLAAHDLGRILNVLVFNRPAPPADIAPPFERKGLKIARWILKTAFVGFAVFTNVKGSYEAQFKYGEKAPKPALYGIYEVEEFSRNGAIVPPLVTDATRWRKVVIQSNTSLGVKMMDDSLRFFQATYDMPKGSLTLSEGKDKPKHELQFSRPDAEHLIIQGSLSGDTLILKTKRIDPNTYRLVNRGFHWINELPFNR
ncbi:MAG: hypothetical protein ABI823_02810 [Bryobacteraceae bacterium]